MAGVADEAAAIRLRPATSDDLPACAAIWHEAISEYGARLNAPSFPPPGASFHRLLAHLREGDPDRFLVACGPEHVGPLGFVSASIRGPLWFLGLLFVRPSVQGAGLGRRLLQATLPAWAVSGGGPLDAAARILATATDSAQPISNALYSGYGMVPRLPVLNLVGYVERPAMLPELPAGVAALRFEDLTPTDSTGPAWQELMGTLGSIDRALLGFEHPVDHRFLRLDARTGFLYRGPDGANLAYGYTSALGRVGPVAVLDPDLIGPVIGHLLRAVEPRGAFASWVPGANDRAVRTFLAAGLRLEGFPTLLCWTRPFADFGRYLPISLALL